MGVIYKNTVAGDRVEEIGFKDNPFRTRYFQRRLKRHVSNRFWSSNDKNTTIRRGMRVYYQLHMPRKHNSHTNIQEEVTSIIDRVYTRLELNDGSAVIAFQHTRLGEAIAAPRIQYSDSIAILNGCRRGVVNPCDGAISYKQC